ncbi:MAG: HNH endonuclease [Alphaproteobacteria bacterium]|nr:HNH endonuclease [Alphaproteobacteria bacterium]
MKMVGFMKKFTIIYLVAYGFLALAMPGYNHEDLVVKKVTAYVREYINPNMPVIEGRKQLSREQQQSLYRWVEGKKFKDISGRRIYTDRRNTFDKSGANDKGSRKYLVRRWCKEYGIDKNAWPKEGTRECHAHHIIPLKFGGLNEWWNIVPLYSQVHREIHSEIDGKLTGGEEYHSLISAFKASVID